MHGWALVFDVTLSQRYPQNRSWGEIGISMACRYPNVCRRCRYADVAIVMFMSTGLKLALFTASHSTSALLKVKVTQHFSRRYLDFDSACQLILIVSLVYDTAYSRRVGDFCTLLFTFDVEPVKRAKPAHLTSPVAF